MFFSVYGHKVSPGGAAHFYSAMKFALRAVTEGIRLELRNMKSGVKITVSVLCAAAHVVKNCTQEISPGLVYTEIFQRSFKCDSDTAKRICDQINPKVKLSALVH